MSPLEQRILSALLRGFWMSIEAISCNLDRDRDIIQETAERLYWRGARRGKNVVLLRCFYRGDWWYRKKED